jgi:hypothetical protein
MRARIGVVWPWYELFKDNTAEPMSVVNAYIMPILEAALEKHKKEKEAGVASAPDTIGEDDTLLDHLVKFTNGMFLYL